MSESIPWARRCGACGHWQVAANPVGGECTADVPFWVDEAGGMQREARFVARDEVRATGCDKFTPTFARRV